MELIIIASAEPRRPIILVIILCVRTARSDAQTVEHNERTSERTNERNERERTNELSGGGNHSPLMDYFSLRSFHSICRVALDVFLFSCVGV